MTRVEESSPRPADLMERQFVVECGICASVGTTGVSNDNALAKTIDGLYNTEVIRRRGPWRSIEAVEYATLEWVDWFYFLRLLDPVNAVPPANCAQEYY
jgi:putative transposase